MTAISTKPWREDTAGAHPGAEAALASSHPMANPVLMRP